MAGVRKKPRKNGKFQGWFVGASGKQKFFIGTKNRAETLRIAKRLEDDHRQVKLGYRPAPQSADRHKCRFFMDVVKEYLTWGNSQGGRGGRPWGKTHATNRRRHLKWWQNALGLKTMADLVDILPKVDKELQGLQNKNLAGKTVANYAESLAAMCDWCVKRKFLAQDPLADIEVFDTTPKTIRRAMTKEEINRLLDICVSHMRLLYEVAFLSGIRAGELKNLTVHHLDVEHGGLVLDAEWTKNRKPGFQLLPGWLLEKLSNFADTGEAKKLYEKFSRRKDTTQEIPDEPLLYVPSHPARSLDIDLKTAGISKYAPGGKLDFHACRVSYINLVIESGASVKEAQELARHSTPQMTMNVYGYTVVPEKSVWLRLLKA